MCSSSFACKHMQSDIHSYVSMPTKYRISPMSHQKLSLDLFLLIPLSIASTVGVLDSAALRRSTNSLCSSAPPMVRRRDPANFLWIQYCASLTTACSDLSRQDVCFPSMLCVSCITVTLWSCVYRSEIPASSKTTVRSASASTLMTG